MEKTLSMMMIAMLVFANAPMDTVSAAKTAKVSKVKIKSAKVTKKKKIKITWKKIKGVKGYQVKVSKKKSGKTTNTVIEVAKGLSEEVELVFDNFSVDNSSYAENAGKDSPVVSIGKDTNVTISLIGENTLIGSSTIILQ